VTTGSFFNSTTDILDKFVHDIGATTNVAELKEVDSSFKLLRNNKASLLNQINNAVLDPVAVLPAVLPEKIEVVVEQSTMDYDSHNFIFPYRPELSTQGFMKAICPDCVYTGPIT